MKALCIGAAVIDYLGFVTKFPEKDDKIRANKCEIALGGNVLNASICLARLGISSKLLTKLGTDYLGTQIVETLKHEGIDTNDIVFKEGATSSFSYIIVDQSSKTRTCINNPCEYLQDLTEIANHQNLLDDIHILVLDGKHPDAASQLTKLANAKGTPALLDAETEVSDLPAFKVILEHCNYVKCGENFPCSFTKRDDMLEALSSLLDLPHKKFVCVTLGSRGSILMQRSSSQESYPAVSNFSELQELIQQKGSSEQIMYCRYAPKVSTCTPGVIVYCPAYKKVTINDTTGAGDVYLGAMAYAILQGYSIESMMRLGAVVAAMKCRYSSTKGIPKLDEIDMQWINQH